MKIVRTLGVLKRQIVYSVAAVALLLSVALPSLVSAAQITARSVTLSSSSVDASNVSYNFSFDADNTSAGALVVEFCSNSPLIGEACTAPGNSFDVATSGNVTGDGTKSATTWTANRAFVTLAVANGTNTFAITGVHNPTVAGTLYARIVSYDTVANAANYSSTALGTGAVDQGSVAFAITDTVKVSGAVLEALTFCVSGTAFAGSDCTGSTAPILNLGKDVGGGVIALSSDDLSTGDVYTKISTNAIQGAVVNLKSSAACGGLALYGTGACNVAPAGTTGTFAAGTAKFGVKLTLPTDNVTDGTIAVGSGYDTSDYRFNYTGPSTGVTSTYGDPIYNTSSGSANNLDTKLTFAASVTNATPAGKYSSDLSLIATGTF